MNYQVKSKQTWKAVSFCSITANTQIDEIKVIQKQDEAFIHRSFYAQNF